MCGNKVLQWLVKQRSPCHYVLNSITSFALIKMILGLIESLKYCFEICHQHGSTCSSEDGTGHLLGEPLLGIIRGNLLVLSEFTLGVLSLCNSLTSSGEDDVEVHTEDTSVGIILDSEIDVFFNTKTEVTYK